MMFGTGNFSRHIEIYDGPMPKEGFQTNFEIVETGGVEWKSVAAAGQNYREYRKGNCESLLLLYLPKGRDNCGVFLGENFSETPR